MAFRLSSFFSRLWSPREPVALDLPYQEQERRRSETVAAPYLQQERRRNSPYHAVSVTAGHPSCEAARQLGTLRFLTGQAPSLPLPGCDVHPCECTYSHYSDRRTGFDRRVEIDGKPPHGLEERRRNNGRRAGDAKVMR